MQCKFPYYKIVFFGKPENAKKIGHNTQGHNWFQNAKPCKLAHVRSSNETENKLLTRQIIQTRRGVVRDSLRREFDVIGLFFVKRNPMSSNFKTEQSAALDLFFVIQIVRPKWCFFCKNQLGIMEICDAHFLAVTKQEFPVARVKWFGQINVCAILWII